MGAKNGYLCCSGHFMYTSFTARDAGQADEFVPSAYMIKPVDGK